MHKQTDEHLIGCEDCKRKIPFAMPIPIIEACKEGKLIIFAGAGISTEGKDIFPYSFYEEIKDEIRASKSLDFPSLMSKYVSKTHDNRLLLNKAKSRIDYSKSFPDLYARVTQFHRALSTIYQIKEIVTTNWDDFFETECAAVSIVSDEDFAFWDQPFRKVFKIHGSINNPGSVVATREDYNKCYQRLSRNVVGGYLRHLLATKTVVFVGYSFGDYDFNKIYKYLKKNMGNILPHAYFVTLSGRFTPKIKEFAPTILNTDATFFIQKLKQELVETNQLFLDDNYEIIFEKLLDIKKLHYSFVRKYIQDDPSSIFCGSYQDGLIHAFERMLQNRNSGRYSHSCNIESSIRGYQKLRKEFLSKKKYFDVAYIDGYLAGLLQMIPELRREIKLAPFYVFGSPYLLFSRQDYLKENRRAKRLHKAAYSWAEKMAKICERGIILQHSNFLMGSSLTTSDD